MCPSMKFKRKNYYTNGVPFKYLFFSFQITGNFILNNELRRSESKPFSYLNLNSIILFDSSWISN